MNIFCKEKYLFNIMSYLKCDNCENEFSKDEIENHKLYCIFSLQKSEMEDLVPCEICNQFINFNTYTEHISFCNFENNIPNIIQHTSDVGGQANLNENTQILINSINNYLYSNNYETVGNNYETLINLDNNNENIGIQNLDNILIYSGDKIDCPICTEKTLNSYKTNCNHFFCQECIEEWLKDNKKCPICMKEFNE